MVQIIFRNQLKLYSTQPTPLPGRACPDNPGGLGRLKKIKFLFWGGLRGALYKRNFKLGTYKWTALNLFIF